MLQWFFPPSNPCPDSPTGRQPRSITGLSAGFTIKLNGKILKLTPFDVTPDTSLNTYLRTTKNLVGTKFMCLEGGCGCCVVTLRRIHPVTKRKYTIAVNSCLQPILACDGVEIETIEYLKDAKTGYHTLQKRLAEYNGSQCGYCSPAMVMGLYSLMESHDNRVTMEQVENSLGGHICRCTGYRPILDAFKSLSMDAPKELRRNPLTGDIEDLPRCKKSGASCAQTCSTDQIRKCFLPEDYLTEEGAVDTTPLLGFEWHKSVDLSDIFDVFKSIDPSRKYTLICGNTAHGVYRRPDDIQVFIDVNNVAVLRAHAMTADKTQLEVGGNVTLSEFMSILSDCAKSEEQSFGYCTELVRHIDLVATNAVRNTGSIAGNLSLKKMHPEFPSDIFLLLELVGARIIVAEGVDKVVDVSVAEFMSEAMNMNRKVLLKVCLPAIKSATNQVLTYKIMARTQNTHAYVNAGFRYEFSTSAAGEVNHQELGNVCLCFGGISPDFVHAKQTEEFLRGKNLFDVTVLDGAYQILAEELQPDTHLLDASPEYRKQLALGLFYKSVLRIAPSSVNVDAKLQSGGTLLQRPLSSGQQAFTSNEKNYPLSQPVMKLEGYHQCAGEAIYSNDYPHTDDDVWCSWVVATEVNATIAKIDPSEALALPGVFGFYSKSDIPGQNLVLTTDLLMIVQNEELFVEDRVLFHGQPCGVIAAKNFNLAQRAARLVKITYNRPSATKVAVQSDVRSVVESLARNRIQMGPVVENIKNSTEEKRKFEGKHEIRGLFNCAGQFHYTMEPQTTVVVPRDGKYDVYSATQWIGSIHYALSLVLKMPSNNINITVTRLGGGYGGKISGGIRVAATCALVSYHLQRPARFVLQLEQNMGSIGKRWPMMGNYHTGFDDQGKIESMHLECFCDAGCTHNDYVTQNVQVAVANCYEAGHWTIKPNAVLTDAPSNLWTRAPGDVEGIAMIESVIEHVAFVTKRDPMEVRMANINPDQPIHKVYKEFVETVEYPTRKQQVEEFNANNRWKKRGIATMPMKYHFIYFGTYSVFLSIYHVDGTISITNGGIEMGQGLNTKACQVAAHFLGAPLELVNCKPSTEQISPNSFPTGGSQTSEALGWAIMKACEELNERFKPIRGGLPKEATWVEVVKAAYGQTVDLTAGHVWRGHEFQPYPIIGVSCAEIELDVLTGNVLVTRVDIEEDVGESMSPLMDVGQVEGAFVMGLGYWLTEKLVYNRENGELLSNRTWHYKPPGAKDIPVDLRVNFLKNSPNPLGILRAKATGEPGVCLSYAVVLAIRHALVSARKDAGLPDEWFEMQYPCLPENILPLTGMLKNPVL